MCFDVVKTDDRQIVGHLKPDLNRRFDHALGHVVVGAYDRRRLSSPGPDLFVSLITDAAPKNDGSSEFSTICGSTSKPALCMAAIKPA